MSSQKLGGAGLVHRADKDTEKMCELRDVGRGLNIEMEYKTSIRFVGETPSESALLVSDHPFPFMDGQLTHFRENGVTHQGRWISNSLDQI